MTDYFIIFTEEVHVAPGVGAAEGVDEVGGHHHPQGQGHQGQSSTHPAATHTCHTTSNNNIK